MTEIRKNLVAAVREILDRVPQPQPIFLLPNEYRMAKAAGIASHHLRQIPLKIPTPGDTAACSQSQDSAPE